MDFTNYYKIEEKIQIDKKDTIISEWYGTVEIFSMVEERIKLIILQYLLYTPEKLYNLISKSQARRHCFRTDIDASIQTHYQGILKLIHDKSQKVMLVGLKKDEGIYEAVLKVNLPNTSMVEKKIKQ